MVNFKESF
jgi:hypothetical protein